MSYILDALRKSDQLRQRGAAPTLMLGQAVAPEPKQPAMLYYGLFALALLGAGIAIGWLRPWQPAPMPAPPAPEVAAAKNPVMEPAPPPDRAQTPVQELKPPQLPQLAAPAVRPAPVSVAPAKPQARARVEPKVPAPPPKPRAEAPQRAATSAQERGPANAAVGAPAPAPVLAMSDLPLAIQQELPPMSISVHAYSGKAGDRLVGINNRLLHEGQEDAPGLKLEQITPDGMILSFRGYSFRRGVH